MAVHAVIRNCCYTLSGFFLISCLAAHAGDKSADGVNGPLPRNMAIEAIFDDAVPAGNAEAVVRRAAELSGQARFEFLADWVLPSGTHSTIRMTAALQQGFGPGSEADPGGLLCPAVVLVREGWAQGQLDELLQRVARVPDAAGRQIQRSKAALLFLVNVAQRDFAKAERNIEQLARLVDSDAGFDFTQFPPEAVVALAGLHTPGAEGLVDEIAELLRIRQLTASEDGASGAIIEQIVAMYGLHQHLAGGRDAKQFFQPPELHSWLLSTHPTGYTTGTGRPRPHWEWKNDALHVRSSHGRDLLSYRIPLTGNFEVNCEFRTGDLEDFCLMYGAQHVIPQPTRPGVRIGGVRHNWYTTFESPMGTQGKWSLCRVVVRDGTCSTWFNGRLMRQRKLVSQHDPWLAFRATSAVHQPSIRNFRIDGAPTVPESIDLCSDSDLYAWWSYTNRLFGEISRHVEDAKGRGISAEAQPYLAGSHCENLLCYYRPLAEDGVLDYDFYYAPNRTEVHPAIGRTAILLQPNGVRLHTVSNGRYENGDTDPAGIAHLPGPDRKSSRLPLRADEWNHCQIQMRGDRADVYVNDQPACSYSLPEEHKRIFGLFHYADQTDAQVRNVIWRGNWGTQPFRHGSPVLFDRSPQLPDRDACCPETFEHSFVTEGLPATHFDTAGDTANRMTAVRETGVWQFQRAGEEWASSSIPSNIRLHGDFDVEVTFADMQLSRPEYGGCAVMLRSQDGHIFQLSRRNREDVENRVYLSWRAPRAAGEFQLNAEEVTSEAAAGRFRLVRRDDVYYFYFADHDSVVWRLVAEQPVENAHRQTVTVELRAVARRAATASVTWKRIRMSAETLEHYRFGVRSRELTAEERETLLKARKLEALVLDGSSVTDEDLSRLKQHHQLNLLYLKGTQITSAGIAHLTSLKRLATLHVTSTAIDDTVAESLGQLKSLRELGISLTFIGDRTVAALAHPEQFEVIGMNHTQVSDRSVPFFCKMTSLRRLDLRRTRVSADGIEKIRKALPECNVQY